MFSRAAQAGLLALPLLTTAALGHGGVTIEKDQCVLRIGPNTVHFAGYQPAHSFLEFCEDIPYTGPTIIVLDLVDSELRAMNTEIRVVRDPEPGSVPIGARMLSEEELANESLEAITEAYMPPSTYPYGTVKFEHDFRKGGQYIGIVKVSNDHGQHYVSQFPFIVGPNLFKVLPFYAILGMALLLAGFIIWKYAWSRRALDRK